MIDTDMEDDVRCAECGKYITVEDSPCVSLKMSQAGKVWCSRKCFDLGYFNDQMERKCSS